MCSESEYQGVLRQGLIRGDAQRTAFNFSTRFLSEAFKWSVTEQFLMGHLCVLAE